MSTPGAARFELEAVKASHKAYLSVLIENYEAEITAARESCASEIADLKAKHTKESGDLKAVFDSEKKLAVDTQRNTLDETHWQDSQSVRENYKTDINRLEGEKKLWQTEKISYEKRLKEEVEASLLQSKQDLEKEARQHNETKSVIKGLKHEALTASELVTEQRKTHGDEMKTLSDTIRATRRQLSKLKRKRGLSSDPVDFSSLLTTANLETSSVDMTIYVVGPSGHRKKHSIGRNEAFRTLMFSLAKRSEFNLFGSSLQYNDSAISPKDTPAKVRRSSNEIADISLLADIYTAGYGNEEEIGFEIAVSCEKCTHGYCKALHLKGS